MLSSFMCFINLFFTPVIGLNFFLKRNDMELRFTGNFLLSYILFTVWNIPFTKILITLARLVDLSISVDSGIYTVVAIISSVFVYGCSVLIKEVFHISFKVNKKNES